MKPWLLFTPGATESSGQSFATRAARAPFVQIGWKTGVSAIEKCNKFR